MGFAGSKVLAGCLLLGAALAGCGDEIVEVELPLDLLSQGSAKSVLIAFGDPPSKAWAFRAEDLGTRATLPSASLDASELPLSATLLIYEDALEQILVEPEPPEIALDADGPRVRAPNNSFSSQITDKETTSWSEGAPASVISEIRSDRFKPEPCDSFDVRTLQLPTTDPVIKLVADGNRAIAATPSGLYALTDSQVQLLPLPGVPFDTFGPLRGFARGPDGSLFVSLLLDPETIYQGRPETMFSPLSPRSPSSPADFVVTLETDASGRLYALTDNAHLEVLDGDSWTRLASNLGIPGSYQNSLVVDDPDEIFLKLGGSSTIAKIRGQLVEIEDPAEGMAPFGHLRAVVRTPLGLGAVVSNDLESQLFLRSESGTWSAIAEDRFNPAKAEALVAYKSGALMSGRFGFLRQIALDGLCETAIDVSLPAQVVRNMVVLPASDTVFFGGDANASTDETSVTLIGVAKAN